MPGKLFTILGALYQAALGVLNAGKKREVENERLMVRGKAVKKQIYIAQHEVYSSRLALMTFSGGLNGEEEVDGAFSACRYCRMKSKMRVKICRHETSEDMNPTITDIPCYPPTLT